MQAIKALLGRIVLKLAGWRVEAPSMKDIGSCVMIMAPHTSNLDFVIGRLAFWAIRVESSFLIKKEAFVFPLGTIARAMGGIPVDRVHSGNIIVEIAKLVKSRKIKVIVITPEGTRSLRHEWKRGFYHIARLADVPIVLAYLDYATKVAGIGGVIIPSGNFDNDLAKIYSLYKGKTALYPEKFNLSPQNIMNDPLGRLL